MAYFPPPDFQTLNDRCLRDGDFYFEVPTGSSVREARSLIGRERSTEQELPVPPFPEAPVRLRVVGSRRSTESFYPRREGAGVAIGAMQLDKMDENDWMYHGEGNKNLVVAHVKVTRQC